MYAMACFVGLRDITKTGCHFYEGLLGGIANSVLLLRPSQSMRISASGSRASPG